MEEIHEGHGIHEIRTTRCVTVTRAANETVFKVKGEEVAVGFVVDGASGETLGFKVLVSDDNDSVAAAELGLSHQSCIAHVRNYVAKNTQLDTGAGRKRWDERDEKLEKLQEGLRELKEPIEELPEEGRKRIGWLHRGYLWAAPPTRKGRQTKRATAAYRMSRAVKRVEQDTSAPGTSRA